MIIDLYVVVEVDGLSFIKIFSWVKFFLEYVFVVGIVVVFN